MVFAANGLPVRDPRSRRAARLGLVRAGVKALAFTCLSSLIFATIAFAVCTRAMAQSTPANTWTGFYVGGHAGYGWGDQHAIATTTLPSPAQFNQPDFSTDLDSAGFIGGVQLGYNWQIAPKWVAGIETDFSYSALTGNARHSPITTLAGVPIPNSYHEVEQSLDWFGTLRGRIGFLSHDNLLLFATGGLAYGRVKYSAFEYLSTSASVQFAGTSADVKIGWTIGGGGEWAFSKNWSAKLEYLYYDLGDQTTVVQNRVQPLANDIYSVVSGNFETTGHIVRVGVNYKFDTSK